MENELPPEPLPDSQAPPDPAPVIALASPPSIVVPVPEVPAYRDRGTGLVIFGIVQIILGLMAALMVPFAVLGAFMSRRVPGGGMRPGQLVSGVATYAFIAAVFLSLGAGSVLKKRWARALTLVTSWYWLIVGAAATVVLTAVLPAAMRGAMAQAQQNATGAPSADLTTGVMAVIITLMIVFFTFFLVLVPIAFVVFYRRKDVELTCRYRDPVERWTDRAPLPVLGASLVFFFGALYNVLLAMTTPMFPFFGRYLTGIPAAGCLVAFAAVDLYLAIALFRLQPSGWWIAAIATPVRMLAVGFSYSAAGLLQAYSKMGWSDEQMQMLKSSPIFHSRVIFGLGVIFMLAFFGYLVWLKRYFKSATIPPQAEALPAQVA